MSFEWLYLYALPFMAILTTIVFFHELGHYLAARYNDVKVDVFSIGFGPELFGFTSRTGTRWKFCLLPLGGYVKMASDMNAASQPDMQKINEMTEEEKAGSLFHKTVWQRIQISAAGPIANYIFAIVVLGGLYATSGQRVPVEEAKIGHIAADSAAEIAGLKMDDQVIQINEQKVKSFEDMRQIIKVHPGEALKLLVVRGDQQLSLTLTPQAQESIDKEGKKTVIGVLGVGVGMTKVRRSLFTAGVYAVQDTLDVTWATIKGIGQMIGGQRSTDGLSGPIGIAQMTGKIATTDISTFLWFMAFLSINLGLINFMPVPMLDGGHLLFYFIEAVRGKPLTEKAQEYGFRLGFALVLCLMLLSTWNDLVRLEVIQSIKNWMSFAFTNK
ncbi:MAG: RIP metalloprotease RseP [Alphaproteobacteria bacterium]|nr:RIP metalloprotease RseP [Alphaproteobacteria bacterium]